MSKTLDISKATIVDGDCGTWEFHCDGDCAVFGGHYNRAMNEAQVEFALYPDPIIVVIDYVPYVRPQVEA